MSPWWMLAVERLGCALYHCSLLGSNSNLTARDLLCGNINGANTQGQKSMLKQGGASRVGPPRLIEAPHADGGVVKVEIQVGCYQCLV